MWHSLKDLGMPSKKGKAFSGNTVLKIDGTLSFDKLKVAKKFNLFYTSVASQLVQSFNMFGKNFVATKMFFQIVCYSQLFLKTTFYLKPMKSLSFNKATGLNGIPSRV